MRGALKAYQASDGDEQSVIVYETNSAAARRIAASRMDIEFSDVEYCRRAQYADAYAPGPVPGLVLISHGWWFECAGCHCQIEQDAERDEENDPRGEFDPVEVGYMMYCSPACRAAYIAKQAARKRAEAKAIARLTSFVRSKLPAAEITGTHAYVSNPERGAKQVVIYLNFPGALYGGATCRIENYGDPEWYVSNGDLAAWNTYNAKLVDSSAWTGRRA